MKQFEFHYEDGPTATHCHTIIVEAVNYSQAHKKVCEEIKDRGVWDWVGKSNIHYHGLVDNGSLV